MFRARALLVVLFLPLTAAAQTAPEGPANEKAKKTYKQALELVQQHRDNFALDAFKKADKQDDGHCLACQRMMVQLGVDLGEWKTAEFAAQEMMAAAKTDRELAIAHYHLGRIAFYQGVNKHKDEPFVRAHEEFTQALAKAANFPDAVFGDGRALAFLRQDDAAKAQFERFVKFEGTDTADRQRALRYVSRPELARARMAPNFEFTAMDGKRAALDDMSGKVVLIDFWATWCHPCREALPHIRSLAKKFQDEPFTILSISLDEDETKWKDFVASNEMTWIQYRDGGFHGPIAQMFGVQSIPHTFTIDADGVLQDEQIGDAAIEGKLKKLIARAKEVKSVKSAP